METKSIVRLLARLEQASAEQNDQISNLNDQLDGK
jgi:uncharacterized coiled-coil protein SlyX